MGELVPMLGSGGCFVGICIIVWALLLLHQKKKILISNFCDKTKWGKILIYCNKIIIFSYFKLHILYHVVCQWSMFCCWQLCALEFIRNLLSWWYTALNSCPPHRNNVSLKDWVEHLGRTVTSITQIMLSSISI